MAERPQLIAAAVMAAGAAGMGAGFANGDAAVYAWQGQAWLFSERTVHLGYLLVAAALAPLGSPGLDALTVLCAGGFVMGAARWTARSGGDPAIGAWIAATAVLPLAAFGEVDVPWACAMAWILACGSPRASAVAAAFAIALSPLTLLALPWLMAVAPDRRRAIATAVLAGVAVLTALGAADWWIGGRGVLHGPDPLPGRALWTWFLGVPMCLLPLAWGARSRQALWLAPLLLAPPDVAGFLIGSLALASAAGRRWTAVPRWLAVSALVVAAGLSGVRLRCEVLRVRAENRAIAALVPELGDDVGLVAPWSVGARASLLATGSPYGLRWRSPTDLLPVQRDRWCGVEGLRIVRLPSDLPIGESRAGCEGAIDGS